MKVTYHFEIERKDRIDFIKKYIGFGNDLATTIFLSEQRAKTRNTPSKTILTDTGIIKIVTCDTEELITAYIATVTEGTAIYRKYYNVKRCPNWFMEVLNFNKSYQEISP